jgi:hypothetical protein
MSAVRQNFFEFTKACQRRFGKDLAQCNDEGAFVLMRDATIHVRLDPDDDRIVFWTDLDMPKGASIDVVEHVASDYVSDRFLETGFVMGVSRSARMIALGRSCESSTLGAEEAFGIISDLEREALAVAARVELAPSDAHGKPRVETSPLDVNIRG